MHQPPPFQVVCLTPPGRGAIAVLVVEGPAAGPLMDTWFCPRNGRTATSSTIGQLVLGRFQASTGPAEELVVRRRSEESWELCCHGGRAVVAMIQRAFSARGARVVSWRDWTTDGHADPIKAAAQLALADARTERTAAILLDQFHGALGRATDAIDEAIDAGDSKSAAQQLDAILRYAALGRHLTHPWSVVLAGPPNVGKSSLLNAIVGYRRAIVVPTPGATRDVVTAAAALDGWPVELADTAGLHETDDAVERAGVERAGRRADSADLLVLVFDLTTAWSDTDRRLVSRFPEAMLVHNKFDLVETPDTTALPDRPPGCLTSALSGHGLEDLLAAMAKRLVPVAPGAGAAVPFTEEQVQRLESVRGGIR